MINEPSSSKHIMSRNQSNNFQETTQTLDSPNNGLSGFKSKGEGGNQEVSGFQESLMQLKSMSVTYNKKPEEEEDELDQRLNTVQKQIDQTKAENNIKQKNELMRKGTINNGGGLTPQNKSTGLGFKGKINSSLLSKLKGIISIDKMKKVQPQKKLTQEEIQKKWLKAMMIIKTVVRLNKISENIRNYGTSYNLFDVATRDRPTVKKVLFPLTTLNDEQEEQELSESLPFPLIHPDSKVNKIWNPIYLFLMLYIATVMPYRIAFEETQIPVEWIAIDYITDAMFWVDLVINMITAFYNEDGQLVTSRLKVFWNYGKSWFIIDFLACFPFELALTGRYHNNGSDNTIKLVKLSRIPRMYRLVRITKVVKLFKVFDKNSFLDFLQFNTGILRLMSLFMTVLLFVHLMGCFWYYIANDEEDEENWVDRSGMRGESNYSLYIASIYYSFTALTTVGYGDITARTNLEMIVTMFWMVFGVGFYSFTIGILSSVLAHMDTKSTNLQKKISIMNEFCNEMKISKDLKQKLRKALTFNSDKNCFSWADQQNIFRQLPINLRYEICMNIHQGVMKTFNFFTMEDDKYFVTRIVPILKPLHMEEGEILWEEGWNPESIYLLSQGRINFMKYIKIEQNEHTSKLTKLQKNKPVKFKSMINGSYFGEIDIIKNRKRQFNAVCDSECEIYYLPRFEYENIIKRDFPHIDDKLRHIAQERDKKNDEALEAIKKILKDPKNTEDDIDNQVRKNTTQTMLSKIQNSRKPSTDQSKMTSERDQKTDQLRIDINDKNCENNENQNNNEANQNGTVQQKVNPLAQKSSLFNTKNSKASNQNLKQTSNSNNNSFSTSTFSDNSSQNNGSQDNSSSYYSSNDSFDSDDSEESENESYSENEDNYQETIKQEVQNVKEELLKYQKKAQIIENKFGQLEANLGSTLKQLQALNGTNQ